MVSQKLGISVSNPLEQAQQLKEAFQKINCKTPLKFFWYLKYSRQVFNTFSHRNLQFPFSISFQFTFKIKRNEVYPRKST